MAVNKENKEIKLGTVIEALPDTMFRVRLDDDSPTLAYLARKMRHFRITVLVGDRVKVEFGSYDQNRGRIVQRL